MFLPANSYVTFFVNYLCKMILKQSYCGNIQNGNIYMLKNYVFSCRLSIGRLFEANYAENTTKQNKKDTVTIIAKIMFKR